MTQYLVAIHHPDDYDPSLEDEAMSRDIDALNDEMKAAGVRIFVGGLQPASRATSIRAKPDGEILVTDMGRTWRPRSMWAGFGCWRQQASTKRWRGDARPPSPVGRRSRCARFIDRQPTQQRLY